TLRTAVGAADVLSLVPAAGDDETPAAKAHRFPGEILDIAKAAFPTAVLQTTLATDTTPVRRDAARILQNAPAFELRDQNVDQLLRPPHALACVTHRDG